MVKSKSKAEKARVRMEQPFRKATSLVDLRSTYNHDNESQFIGPSYLPDETQSSRRTRYTYTPLNEEAGEIRLLILHPGTFSSEIQISLEITPFTEEFVPEFKALSYTWGSAENPADILICSSGFGWLSVTRNLAEALPYLRYEDKPRVLWIDAICVNQQDKAERSSQVKRMANIFPRATRAVVWLGPESDDTPIAMDYIELLCSKVEADWSKEELRSLSNESHWADIKSVLIADDDQVRALGNCFGHPWFERLWIWQEIRLASSSSIVIWGSYHILWQKVRSAVLTIYAKPFPAFVAESVNLVNHISNIYNLCNYKDKDPKRPLLWLLQDATQCKCSDSRDRIFALLSMVVREERRIGIQPDYLKTVAEVYQDAFVRYSQHYGSLDLMASIEWHNGLNGLPSWVPDWSIARITAPFKDLYASARTESVESFLKGGILRASGVSIARIEHVSPFDTSMSVSITETINELRRLALRGEFQGVFLRKTKALRTLWGCLCAGEISEKLYPPREGYSTLEQGEKVLYNALAEARPNENATKDEEYSLWRSIRWFCPGRAFFLSENGRTGLAPRAAQVGDLITVILGCNSPMILRPKQNNQYQVIGEAYCDGVKNGEALLGPLPRDSELVWRQCPDGGGGVHPAFLDRRDGSIQTEDPRFGQLPEGWRIASHEEEFEQLFENVDGGELTRFDPRKTPVALKERCVDLRTFNLV